MQGSIPALVAAVGSHLRTDVWLQPVWHTLDTFSDRANAASSLSFGDSSHCHLRIGLRFRVLTFVEFTRRYWKVISWFSFIFHIYSSEGM
jgi:hypothetical protein